MASGGPPQPPKYVMLSENLSSLRPPPYRRNIPRYQSEKSRKNVWLRCICFIYCCLFFLSVIIICLAFFLYSMYTPKVPSYQVEDFQVQAFNIETDMSLYAKFAVTVTALNPNLRIGFTYGKKSLITVSYSGTTLCAGKLPAFHQPPNNETKLEIVLKGNSPFGSGLQEALMENKNTGKIPLLVRVKAPVNIVLGHFPLKGATVYINCSLVVDNLSPKKKIGILSSVYDYNLDFNWF